MNARKSGMPNVEKLPLLDPLSYCCNVDGSAHLQPSLGRASPARIIEEKGQLLPGRMSNVL